MTSDHLFVLRPEAALKTLVEYARAAKWPLVVEEARAHSQAARRVWTPTPDSEVTWREEHSIGVRVVWVTNAAPLATEIASMLPHFTRDELLAAAGGDAILPALDALRALAILDHRRFSEEVRAAYVRWMGHEDRAVRRAVLHVGWIGGWKGLSPDVARQQAVDAELGEAWGKLAATLARI